jgi:uncharacterized glyoxalase superfamily protein PhnB
MVTIRNRSVPPETVLPHIVYRDLPGAIAWLTSTFGFIEHYRYGEPLSGAQVRLGDAWMMLNAAKPGYRNPSELGFGTQSLTIFVPDVEAHFARTKAAGTRIVEDLHETAYGELQYGVEDLEGHHWLFSRHARNVSPDAWGATITNPQ